MQPPTLFILLKIYYLRWNHLTAPCGFTLVLNIVGVISMINNAADQGLFDLLNITSSPTVPCLYSMQPPTLFILLKIYYLRWNHLTAPCGFTLVLNIVGVISMINNAADQGLFDLLNITSRNIKTKANMLSIKNVRFHLIPSYPYLQVLHTLKLYFQFEHYKKLFKLVGFSCQLVFIYHFNKVL